MALSFHRKRLLLTKVITAVNIVVLALVFQPMVAGSVANALSGSVSINEIMPNPVDIDDADGEWIELKNNSNAVVDISGWTVAGGTVPLGQTIEPNGLYVLCRTILATVECDATSETTLLLANSGDRTIVLQDSGDVSVDSFSYQSTANGQSIEIVNESGVVTGKNNSTDAYLTNEPTPHTGNKGTPGVANRSQAQTNSTLPAASINGENFNTHSGTDYSGINVGFNVAHFKEVSSVTVELYDASNSLLVANTHNQKLLDLINDDNVSQLSTPFITVSGTYIEEYWNLGTYIWTSDSPRPTSAIIEVKGLNNANETITESTTLTHLTEPNDWTFAAILPELVSTPGFEVDGNPKTENDGDNSGNGNGDGDGDGDGEGEGGQTFTEQLIPTSPIVSLTPQLIQFGLFDNGPIGELSTTTGGGESQNNTTDSPSVLGTKDEDGTPLNDTAALDARRENGVLLGLSWPWWIGILAALTVVWLVLAAIIRRIRGIEL